MVITMSWRGRGLNNVTLAAHARQGVCVRGVCVCVCLLFPFEGLFTSNRLNIER